MTATIKVTKQRDDTFDVVVSEGGSQSSHTVFLKKDYHQKLTGGTVPAEQLVHRSFEFLLERESKESILREFDLPVIARYFPEYEREIKKRLS